MLKELLPLLRDATITLPAMEIGILLVALTCCLVLRFTRIGLITAYFFTYRWGLKFFAVHEQKFWVSYLAFGCVVAVFTVISMLRAPAHE